MKQMLCGVLVAIFALCFFSFNGSAEDNSDQKSKIPDNAWFSNEGFVVHEWGVRIFPLHGKKQKNESNPKHFKSAIPTLKMVEKFPELIPQPIIEIVVQSPDPKAKPEIIPKPIPKPIPIPIKAELPPVKTHKPVIYFYNDGKLKFDCTVEFADSVPDVWYPDAKLQNADYMAFAELGSWLAAYEEFYQDAFSNMMSDPFKISYTIPAETQAVYLAYKKKYDDVMKDLARCDEKHLPALLWKGVQIKAEKGSYPKAPEKHWVSQARNVKALTVDVKGHDEKYLFYEGKGRNKPELRAESVRDQLVLYNSGKHNVHHVMIVALGKKRCFFKSIPLLKGDSDEGLGTASVKIKAKLLDKDFAETCNDSLIRDLETSGLYKDEAEAMAGIWKETFFQEEGLRVLYIWDQARYDEAYPLRLSVEPKKIKRVMVAVIELKATEELKLD